MHVRVADDPRASPPVDSGTLSSIRMLLACSLACKYWDSPIRGISPDNLAVAAMLCPCGGYKPSGRT